MSDAKPMTADRRAAAYQAQRGGRLMTPAQRRRTRQKNNRLKGED